MPLSSAGSSTRIRLATLLAGVVMIPLWLASTPEPASGADPAVKGRWSAPQEDARFRRSGAASRCSSGRVGVGAPLDREVALRRALAERSAAGIAGSRNPP